jgi:hypothetical protein
MLVILSNEEMIMQDDVSLIVSAPQRIAKSIVPFQIGVGGSRRLG